MRPRFPFGLLFNPPLVGAMGLSALVVLAADGEAERAALLGVFVEKNPSPSATVLMGTALVAGVVLGLLGDVLVLGRDHRAGRAFRPTGRRAMRACLVAVSLHAFFMACAMVRLPHRYASWFYDRGGVLRTVQVLVTDVLGRAGVLALGCACLFLYLAGPRTVASRPSEQPARARSPWTGKATEALQDFFHRRWGRLFLAAATVLGGIVAAFLEAHSQGERSASSAVVSKDRPNVLLVSVGGLRADHLNARQTPHMAALAEKGVRFQRAYVSLPRALPSLTTWLTGMVPHHHGLRQTFAKSEDLQRVQDALPRRLRRAGYRTALVTDGPLALASGLGWTDEVPLEGPRTVIHALPALPFTAPLAVLPYAQWPVFQHLLPAQRFKASGDDPFAVAQQAIEALDELGTTNAAGEGADGDPRPFFLTVSLSSPKFPYRSPAPYYRAFTSSSYRGPFKYQGMTSLSKEYKPNGYDREQVRRLYDGAVHAADEAVGRILDHLEAQGLASSTVVVLMSESGDALDEQGRGFGAGASLVGDEGTHVPLVIVDPRRPGGSSVDTLVRDVDLAPTLYDLTGVHPSGELDGQSLVAALEHKKLAATFAFAEAELPAASVRGISVLPADPRAFVPRGRPGQPDALGEDEEEQLLVGRQRMVRDERWKLVYAPQRTGVKYMLFDTWQDPGETRDLAAAQGEQVERLRGVLWPWLRSDPRMVERGGLLVAKDTRPEEPARVAATTSADDLKSADGNDSLPASPESPADEVAYRFVDRVAEAKVDAPRLEDTNRALRVHWRKMGLPWTNLSDADRSNVTSIALRTSPREVQRSFVRGTGARWSPDPRVWNLNEGTFDQRESLLAPTPATYSYALTVPPFAKFQVSPGLMDSGGREVRFRVVLRDAAGQEHELYSHRMGEADERHWVDASVDLGQFAGQNVVLSLLTTSEASPTPSVAASPWGTRLDIVGGVPEWSPHVPGVGLALWGNPVLLTKTKTRAAYNVLWVTVHGWRPDLMAAFHDAEEDRAKGQAERPAGFAWLAPTMGLLPSLERGVGEGVRFLSAYSAGTWERPSTLAMLAGTYPSEAGDDGAGWTLAREKAKKLYAQGQPLLPLVLRGAGVTTRAFGNAPSLVGYAPVGLDMGFERVQDYRYRGKDAEALTQDATQWLAEHADQRFFVYCHYGLSYDTDAKGGLPPGPSPSVLEGKVQRYQQAMARTDRALGQLLDALEKNHLKERTLVVLTADQGEMLSEVHGEVPSMDVVGRTPHPPDLYEEALRIPLAMVLPGVLKRGLASTHPVRSVDIAPTVLGLLRLEKPTRMRGRSLVPLLLGGTVDELSLPLVSEGGGRRGIRFGTYRYVRRESSVGVLSPATPLPPEEELYDLARDPGEMHNLVRSEPEKVAEMRARLAAALAHVPAADEAGALAEPTSDSRSVLKIRVTGAGKVLPFRGTVHIKAPKWSSHGTHVSVKAVGLGDESWNLQGPRFDFAMTSSPNAVVGFDVAYEPAESAVEWSFYEDEKALPADHFFVGPFGVPSHAIRAGLFGEEAKDECLGAALPAVRPQVDRGLFVVCGPEKGFRTDGAEPGALGSGLDPTWMSSLGYGSPWRTVKK